MKPPYFEVRAACGNSRCEAGVLHLQRKKAHYQSTDGHLHPIEKVVCPDCGMHAAVTGVREVAA